MERYFPKFSKRLAHGQLHIRDPYFSQSTTAPTHIPRDIIHNFVVLDSASELSGLSPEMVGVLAGRSAGGNGPAAGVKKNKKKKKEVKPGEGKSKFAVARREKKATQEAAKKAGKEAEPASSSSSTSTAAAAPTAEKKAAESAAAAKTPAESKPEAAEPEPAVDFVDCSLGEKADEEMTGA